MKGEANLLLHRSEGLWDDRHSVLDCTEAAWPGMEYKFGLSGMIYESSNTKRHKIPRVGRGNCLISSPAKFL
jgi:hypothetical protein